MSTETHTPGPWHVTGTYDGGNTVAMIRSSDRSVNVGAGDPEKPWDSLNTYEHTDANARLIAAAPDLLAALEAREKADAAFDAWENLEGGDGGALFRAALKSKEQADALSKAALARVRGEGEG